MATNRVRIVHFCPVLRIWLLVVSAIMPSSSKWRKHYQVLYQMKNHTPWYVLNKQYVGKLHQCKLQRCRQTGAIDYILRAFDQAWISFLIIKGQWFLRPYQIIAFYRWEVVNFNTFCKPDYFEFLDAFLVWSIASRIFDFLIMVGPGIGIMECIPDTKCPSSISTLSLIFPNKCKFTYALQFGNVACYV